MRRLAVPTLLQLCSSGPYSFQTWHQSPGGSVEEWTPQNHTIGYLDGVQISLCHLHLMMEVQLISEMLWF